MAKPATIKIRLNSTAGNRALLRDQEERPHHDREDGREEIRYREAGACGIQGRQDQVRSPTIPDQGPCRWRGPFLLPSPPQFGGMTRTTLTLRLATPRLIWLRSLPCWRAAIRGFWGRIIRPLSWSRRCRSSRGRGPNCWPRAGISWRWTGAAWVGAGGYSLAAPGPRGGPLGAVAGRDGACAPCGHGPRAGAARHRARVMEEVLAASAREGAVRHDCLSTRTAVPFYAALGFRVIGEVEVPLAPGIAFRRCG